MCGIIGVFSDEKQTKKKNFSKKFVIECLKRIEHRGLDDSKIFEKNNVIFGHNLHSIVSFVPQPIIGTKGMLVANCEIYNWKEICKTHSLKAKNDAETILKLIEAKQNEGKQNNSDKNETKQNKIKNNASAKKTFSEKDFIECVNLLDGDFAFAYHDFNSKKIFIARDFAGMKPLVFINNSKSFAFASEKKAFGKLAENAVHLNPRKGIIFDCVKQNISEIDLYEKPLTSEKTLAIANQKNISIEKDNSNQKLKLNYIQSINSTEELQQLESLESSLLESVSKRIPEKKFAVLLSGGLDSTLLASILAKASSDFVCYFSYINNKENSFSPPKDLEFVRIAAKELKIKLVEVSTSIEELEKELPNIIQLIESTDPVRVAVCSTLYFALKAMKDEKVVFSGIGADELFAGYDRFKRSNSINADCWSYFTKLYENDLYSQDIIAMKFSKELRAPFLDKEFSRKALIISEKLKFKINKLSESKSNENNLTKHNSTKHNSNENKSKELLFENKIALRLIAKKLGINETITQRPKKAAQYGSNFDKAIELLTRKNKFVSKADYLNTLGKNIGKEKNTEQKKNSNEVIGSGKSHPVINASIGKGIGVGLGALVSTGKDSIHALHLMHKQGYKINCIITIASKNKDSFMFHSPTISLAKLQAKAMEVPIIFVETNGEKEKELIELEKAFITAKNKYKIEGICSGALKSSYQRSRIENLCEKTGLRSFSPLWNSDEKNYLNLITKTYTAIITKIAGKGLDESWLGKTIDANTAKKLHKLNELYGLSVVGEGGEYESLVLDAPLFKEKIEIVSSKIIESGLYSAELIITKAKLVEK